VTANRPTTLAPDRDSISRDTHREIRRVAVAAAIGNGLEYYDWFLYGLFAALVAGKLFFPTMDPIVGTLAAFLTFALGSVARPLGSIFFGHIGDRYGRKAALIGTITLMGLSSGAIGLLPTYAAVGVAAPIMLSVLRLIQGFSVGGEWAGAVSLTMESASSTHRGRWLGLVLLGSQLGGLASTGIFALLSGVLTQEQFSAFGWRIPFLVGFLLLGVGIYLRLRIEESPLFQKALREKRTVQVPLVSVLRNSWGRVIASFCAAQSTIGGYFLAVTFMIAYATKTLHLPLPLMLDGALVGSAVCPFVVVATGWLVDWSSAVKVGVVTGLLMIVLAFPLFAMVHTGEPALIYLSLALGAGVVGTFSSTALPAIMGPMFDDSVRYTGMALSFALAGIFGGFVPAIATSILILTDNQYWGPATFLIVLGIMTLGGALAAGRLTRQKSFL
jgi:MFS family permease